MVRAQIKSLNFLFFFSNSRIGYPMKILKLSAAFLLVVAFSGCASTQVHSTATAVASNSCSTTPGGACYAGPGGPAYAGPGGPMYAGPGGPLYAGPGGPLYAGPGGPRYSGPGGPAYNGPGGACYAGPGGACDAVTNVSKHCPAICKPGVSEASVAE